MPRETAKTLAEKFHKMTTPGAPNSCWMWTWACDKDGYGYFRFRDKIYKAHRVSHQLYNGPIPQGHGVLHRCDTPGCHNPQHLFTGTQRDNCLDASRKGRTNQGEKAWSSKLTAEQVVQIRALHRKMPQKSIAEMFGVKPNTVSQIINRIWWRHI